MENRYRDALIQDLNVDEVKELFWLVYHQMCDKHKTEMDSVVATALLTVTKPPRQT